MLSVEFVWLCPKHIFAVTVKIAETARLMASKTRRRGAVAVAALVEQLAEALEQKYVEGGRDPALMSRGAAECPGDPRAPHARSLQSFREHPWKTACGTKVRYPCGSASVS
jgi:hypothetical protein